jgi:uncharacterized protein
MGAFLIAVFLEASPFLFLGALISSIIEVFVPDDFFLKLTKKSSFLGALVGMFGGLVLPICECGVVPVTRKMMIKGMPPRIAITYMLAAPVINPIVIAATWFAFRGRPIMVFLRVGIVGIIALCTGYFVGKDNNGVVKEECCSENHSHDTHGHLTGRSRISRILTHTAEEFFEIGSFFLLGAFMAAAAKTFLPQGVLLFFSKNILISIIAMMFLAVLLSVCSEADSFVANSFVFFPLSSQLAFITIGPMVDIKLILMYRAAFTKKTYRIIIIFPILLTFTLTLLSTFILGV